jgi:hypothetical protein
MPIKRASGNCPTNRFPSRGYKDAHDPHTGATHKAAFICMSVQGRLMAVSRTKVHKSDLKGPYSNVGIQRLAQKHLFVGTRRTEFLSHTIQRFVIV